MIITCTPCGKEYDPEPNLHRRPWPAISEDAEQIYIVCPHCQAETHSHYVNAAIRRRQLLVSLTLAHYHKRRSDSARADSAWRRHKQAQADLQREFDKLNKMHRPAPPPMPKGNTN